MKKLLSIMLVLTMALTLLAGCGGSGSSSAPAASSGPASGSASAPAGAEGDYAGQTLKVAAIETAYGTAIWEEIVKAFEAKTGATVELTKMCIRDRDGVSIVDKPTFGCAALPAEAEALCGGAPDSIEICGVVTDICVVSNAVLLHSAFLNARVAVLKDLCAAATPEGHARALALLAGMGYEIV